MPWGGPHAGSRASDRSCGARSVRNAYLGRVGLSWSISKEADGANLALSENFSTKAAPDLKFFLHKLPAGQVNAKNATQGVFVGDLPKAKGASRIKLPANVDPAQDQSVVLTRKQCTVFWGAGDINGTARHACAGSQKR